jgi:predicted 3-demethylubiquinone-9 3-methyltransferase (glyoxalase superfamily)
MTELIPNLWFNADAETAVAFYIATFGGRETGRLLYPASTRARFPVGTVCTIDFEIAGHKLAAVNGQEDAAYTHALSLIIVADTQAEVDRMWDAILAGGGTAIECGWIRDRWGVNWQIVPRSFQDLMASGDDAAIGRAFEAMLDMVKLDGPALERAARGKAT